MRHFSENGRFWQCCEALFEFLLGVFVISLPGLVILLLSGISHMQRLDALFSGHLHVAMVVIADHHQLVRTEIKLLAHLPVEPARSLGQAKVC